MQLFIYKVLREMVGFVRVESWNWMCGGNSVFGIIVVFDYGGGFTEEEFSKIFKYYKYRNFSFFF